MNDNDEDNDKPINLENTEIRDRCEKMARKFLPQVETALDILFELDPYKGILAWERVAEFAVAKKSKEGLMLPTTNITVNLIPVEQSPKTIDITAHQKEIENNNEKNVEDNLEI